MKAIFLLLLNFCLLFTPLIATEDKGIQAVATLLFHIDQEITSLKNLEKDYLPIVFESRDLENLWSRSLEWDSSLEQAYKLYDDGLKNSSMASLEECKNDLRTAWISATHIHEKPLYKCSEYSIKQGPEFGNHPLLNTHIKKEIKPFLLNSHSSLYKTVNQIFTQYRVTLNVYTLIQAGFNILCQQPRSFITVASHPAVPGMLFKLYFDSELRKKNNVPGWKWFVKRCVGAESIRNVIKKKNIKHFTVPKKYIYVLPSSTLPPLAMDIDPKLALLIVQDMDLASDELNYAAWKFYITPEILDELYLIISHSKGSSYRPDNITLTKEGTFAFIDTEYPTAVPDYQSIRPYLSAEMCAYWDQLIKQGG